MRYYPKAGRVNWCVHLRWIFLLVFSIQGINAGAQFQRYRNYDVKDGLPSSEVYDMLQDDRGFMWFTTDMGVSRYDGYEFRNFTTENGLPDNTIFNVYQDHARRIWFTSFSGKLSYFLNDQIRTLPCNDALEQLIKGTFISSLYVDEGDTIWAGTTGNFLIRIAPGWSVEQLDTVQYPAKEGYMVLIDSAGFVFGGGFDAAAELTVYEKTERRLFTLNMCSGIIAERGVRYSVLKLRNGNFLLTMNNAIAEFNSSGIIHCAPLNAIGICTMEEPDGSIVAGTYDGLFRWNGSDFSGQQAITKFDQKIITAIVRDRENGLWYCTEGNGVYCVTYNTFLYYTAEDGLPESKITSTATLRDAVATGHIDGSVSILRGTSISIVVPESKNAFPGLPGRIASLMAFDDHEVLVSTGNSFYMIDANNSAVRIIPAKGGKKMIRARDGGIWAFRFRSLAKYGSKNFEVEKEVGFGLYGDNIYEDESGTIWICAINGLWAYDSISGVRFFGDSIPLLATRIVDVGESADHLLWLSCRGRGVVVKDGDSVYHIQHSDGLAANMCRSLYIDTGKTVWVGTNNGLSRIRYSLTAGFKYTIKNFTAENGLLTNEVNDIFRQGEKMWAVHNSGISVFNPTGLEGSDYTPPIYITAVTVNGDSVQGDTGSFSHNENYVSFSFVGLSFRDPGEVRYRYKLEGADPDWITTRYTTVNYQTLAPGDYRFVVEASSNEGYWSGEQAIVKFTILPAWWQTWIFRIGVILVISLMIYLAFRWRVNSVRQRHTRKAELQNRIATFELNALRAQMNPHFVFNSINSVQYFITSNDPDSSQKYLSKFAKLIRYVVDNSKLSYISVKSELEALTLYLELESLRFGKRLHYSIEISEEVDTEYMQMPSMLIQPYVENSIWHGIMHKQGEGHIRIQLTMDGKTLCCAIEDDGIGREKSQEMRRDKPASAHKSVGMSNTRERLEIINQVSDTNMSVKVIDLLAADGTSSGTRVEIRIPIH